MPAQQILQIRPDTELVFRGPFDKVVTSGLRLKNPSASVVAFKVKTTAPKRYCVRPNSGLVQPNSEVEVAVMLQPFEFDVSDKSARHKFMVQSLVVANSAVESLEDLWKSATSDTLMDSKLKVVLDPGPEDKASSSASQPTVVAAVAATAAAAPPPAAASSAPVSGQQPVLTSTPASAAAPVAAAAAPAVQPLAASLQKQQQQPGTASGESGLKQQQQLHSSPAVQRKVAAAAAEPSSAAPQPHPQTSAGTGSDSNRGLQSEIQRLKDENARLAEQELRLRKLAMRDTKASDPASPGATAVSSGGQQPHQLQQHAPAPMPPVLFLILALVLGLIVGKFIL